MDEKGFGRERRTKAKVSRSRGTGRSLGRIRPTNTVAGTPFADASLIPPEREHGRRDGPGHRAEVRR